MAVNTYSHPVLLILISLFHLVAQYSCPLYDLSSHFTLTSTVIITIGINVTIPIHILVLKQVELGMPYMYGRIVLQWVRTTSS